MQGGRVDPAVVLVDAPLFPVAVVGAVLGPVGEVGGVGRLKRGVSGHGQRPVPGGGVAEGGGQLEIGLQVPGPLGGLHRQQGRPVADEGQREGAPVVGPPVVVLGGGESGGDGGQRRRPGGGGQQLGGAHVGEAHHPHPAVGAGQAGRPLHRVVAVVRLVPVGVELAFGGVAPPAVLDRHHIPLGGEPGRMGAAESRDAGPLVVDGAGQQDRELGAGLGPVYVGPQDRPVPHDSLDVALDLNVHAGDLFHIGDAAASRCHSRSPRSG